MKLIEPTNAYGGCPIHKVVDSNGNRISVFPALSGIPVTSSALADYGPLFLEDLFRNPYYPTEKELVKVRSEFGVDLHGIDRILRLPQL